MGRRRGLPFITAGIVLMVTLLFGVWAGPSEAQDTGPSEMDEVVVEATRFYSDPGKVPGSISVIDRETIEKEMAVSRDLGDILGKNVPGFAPGNNAMSNFGQTLRGRKFLMMIDGVPQSTPLRDGARELQSIDPSRIERIEIIRGSSAIYGYGGAGGIVNVVTRETGSGGPHHRSSFQVGGSEHDPDDSLRGSVSHEISGGNETSSYRVSALYGVVDGFFDAEGDRIPSDPRGQGGLAEGSRYDLSGKYRREFGDHRSWELQIGLYNNDQDRDYGRVNGDISQGEKTTAEEGAPSTLEDPGNENNSAQWTVRDRRFFGNDARLRLYYQDFEAMFDTGAFFGNQTFIQSEKMGARAELQRDANLGLSRPVDFVYGIDYLHDETEQADLSGNSITPDMEQSSWAPFLQAEVPLTSYWKLETGVRYERIKLDVPTYTKHPSFGGGTVQGGTLRYDETLVNLGSVWYLTDYIDLRAAFSQGFSVADIGRSLRSTDASSVEEFSPEAQIVDNYELGLRGQWARFDFDLVGFYSRSEFGTTFNNDLIIQRQPEHIWGTELSLNHDPAGPWSWGSSFTWMEGKTDPDDDGRYEEYLTGDRIPPLKLTGDVEYQWSPSLTHSLRYQYWGERDRFEGSTEYAKGEVDSEFLLDYYVSYGLSNGSLSLGVENLTDRFYFPVRSQWPNLDSTYTAGQGRTFTITYDRTW